MSKKRVNQYHFDISSSQEERIINALKLLEMNSSVNFFKVFADRALKNKNTPLDYLETLLENEMAMKEENRIKKWRMQARFPVDNTINDFNFNFQPSIDMILVKELCSGRFIMNGQDVIFLGPPGVGKTHLAIAIGLEVIQRGYNVRYIKLSEFVDMVDKAEEDLQAKKRLIPSLLRPQLLILDSLDFCSPGKEASRLFGKLIIDRHEKNLSTIFISSKKFDEWYNLFSCKNIAEGCIDRLNDKSYLFNITGNSYRIKDKLSKRKLIDSQKKKAA